jgi:serine/threonine protein phosphatase PrpC
LQIEYAELSLIGGREENQDRVAVVTDPKAVLAIVADGMGGHAGGARAAECAIKTIAEVFGQVPKPVFDPQGYMHRAVGMAHEELVEMAPELNVEFRPRATCVVCLIQDGAAYWAHMGDSRIYLIRGDNVHERTRDHSHVELLLEEGLITENEMANHPMRNFVECCLGGDPTLPGMYVTNQKRLVDGDVLLACSDGFWSGLRDEEISMLGKANGNLSANLKKLGEQAVIVGGANADNTSAVALRWRGQKT